MAQGLIYHSVEDSSHSTEERRITARSTPGVITSIIAILHLLTIVFWYL